MKKFLVSSTSLVAVALFDTCAIAAEPIKIGVGGYYIFYAQAGAIEGSYALNGSSTQYKANQFIQEGEIHFTGQTKLDNGTTVGLQVQLEGWNPSVATGNRQIDEAYIFAFGDWGRTEIGARDPAGYRMWYGAPSALIEFGFLQHNSSFNWANGSALANNKANLHVTAAAIGSQVGDANRINYFTPRFSGLQIGIGYAPKWNPFFGFPGITSGPTPNLNNTCGFSDPTTASNCPTNDFSYQDMIDIGANYINKFGDVTVAAYGAFLYASFVPGFTNLAAVANTVTGYNQTSLKQWVTGLQLGWSGFTIGGNIGWDNHGVGGNYYTGADNDTRFYNAGIMYETGPWQLSFGWAGSYNDNGNGSRSILAIAPGTNAITLTTPATSSAAFSNSLAAGGLLFGTESAQKFELGANYQLGPGIHLTGGGLVYNYAGPSNAVTGQAWGVMLGMDFRY
jgi:outer membrane protein OmpU